MLQLHFFHFQRTCRYIGGIFLKVLRILKKVINQFMSTTAMGPHKTRQTGLVTFQHNTSVLYWFCLGFDFGGRDRLSSLSVSSSVIIVEI